jgi:serine/threonine-protein kinase SRPK3
MFFIPVSKHLNLKLLLLSLKAETALSCRAQASSSMFSFARRPISSSQPSKLPKAPRSLPSDIPIEEELLPGYNPNHFYHPNPGDVLDGRFKLKAKLGFGMTSTVWLAQDTRQQPGTKTYVAIKICNSNVQDEDAARHELEMSTRITSCSDGDERKYEAILPVKESFEIKGGHGSHLCLVMQPMREPIWLMRRRICEVDKVTKHTLVLFKLYILQILSALQYLHHDCKIIHTGKLDQFVSKNTYLFLQISSLITLC